ncbi:TPA_asm: UL51 uoORF, partial [Human alphaherpesvirus 1]
TGVPAARLSPRFPSSCPIASARPRASTRPRWLLFSGLYVAGERAPRNNMR